MAVKSPEPEGAAQGQGLFTAIISEATCYNYYMFHPIGQTVWLPWIPHITIVTYCVLHRTSASSALILVLVVYTS